MISTVARRRGFAVATVLLGGLLAAACTRPPHPHPGPGTGPRPTVSSTRPSAAGPVGKWIVTGHLDRQTGTFKPQVPGALITIEFKADGSYGGKACNNYGGNWAAQGDRLTLTNFFSTLMLCTGPIGEEEATYYPALEHVGKWAIDDAGLLTLSAADGTRLVTAEPDRPVGIDPPAVDRLAGTSWVLDPASLGVPLPEGSSIDATFAEGRVTGIAACNQYGASYTVRQGNRIELGDIVTTRRACEEPILRAEQAFTTKLRSVTTYRLDNNRLSLGDGRAELLRFTRKPVAPAAGPVGSWRVTRYMNAGDGLSPVLPGTTISLEFSADGRVSGRACNSYFGSWSVDGEGISIGALGSTRMACSPPEVMTQEGDYFTALSAATRWKIEGDTLTLSHPRGTSVIAERARG